MNKEAIETIERFFQHIENSRPVGIEGINNYRVPQISLKDLYRAKKALTLLKEPKCKTCGGTGEIENPINSGEGNKWNCPDCKPEEPLQGEFTKTWREKLDNAVALFKMGRRADDWFQDIVAGFKEACYRLDRQATEIKKLRAAINRTITILPISKIGYVISELEQALGKKLKEKQDAD